MTEIPASAMPNPQHRGLVDAASYPRLYHTHACRFDTRPRGAVDMSARKTPTSPANVLAPSIPQTPEEIAHSEAMIKEMQRLTVLFRQRNLDNAVALAQEAAAGRGDLIEHFQELGRRFKVTPPVPKKPPTLRTIEGGARKPKKSGAAVSLVSERETAR